MFSFSFCLAYNNRITTYAIQNTHTQNIWQTHKAVQKLLSITASCKNPFCLLVLYLAASCPCRNNVFFFLFSSVFNAGKNKIPAEFSSLAMNPSLPLRPVGSAPARRLFFFFAPTSWATHQLTAVAAQWVKSKSH